VSDFSDPSSAPLSTATSFTFHSIGTISSVFKLKYGTPRQGTIAPTARGTFTLAPSIPASALEGLEEYSHVWLVFVFHANSNKQFRPKVEPPRAGGKKMGVYATRSPHRLNPLGLSLVRLERVEGRVLHLSALDLIEGTPIIDVKPYHPADCVTGYTIPAWMREQAEVKPPFHVDVDPPAQRQIAAMVQRKQLDFYHTYDEALAAVCESVSHDPRPIYIRARASPTEVYGFRLDRMHVLFRVDDAAKRVLVLEVQYVDYDKLLQEQREEAEAEAGGSGSGNGSAAPLSVEDIITKRFLSKRPKQAYLAAAAEEQAGAGSKEGQGGATPATAAAAAVDSSSTAADGTGASMDAQ
jgi:tRNA-Thr(GGU) m(6)t(6)A37 methyltransferase TsaA